MNTLGALPLESFWNRYLERDQCYLEAGGWLAWPLATPPSLTI